MKSVKQLIITKITTCLFAFALVLSCTSCSTDDQYDVVSKPVIQSETLSYQDQIAMENFLISIHNLNAQYPTVSTRGAFLTSGAVCLADNAGGAAGGAIGAWTGSALGSAAGPWGAIVGNIVGRRIGPYVCSFLASGAVGWLCSRKSSRAVADVGKELEFVSIILDKDSIGYYHNQMMVKLGINHSKYIDKSESVNYELMYDDIVSFFREIGRYDITLENPLIKSGIINQIKKLCEISKKYEINPSDENFVKEQCEFLKYNCNVSDLEVNLYKNFNVPLYEKYSTLPVNQIDNYTRDLIRLIENSGFSSSVQESLKKSSDLTINSTLYWRINL